MSAMFYRSVVQTVLLFGAEIWVLLEAIYRKLEGVYVGFLRMITGQRAVRHEYRTWRKVAAEKFLEKSGTQTLGTYIDRRKATVSEWMALSPILEVYDIDTGYEGEDMCRDLW